MNTSSHLSSPDIPALTNGSGAAALLSAGIGAFAVAVLAFAGDKSALVRSHLAFYKPTGPLSGVTSVAVLIWLLTWGILEWRWRKKAVAMGRISATAIALLCLSLVLTFPPFVDLF
jgi:hypothetical protein